MSDIDLDKCSINHYPRKVLSQKALPITEINDTIRNLVDKMIDIMIERNGIGLAGPQAGVGLRIFVISLDGSRENAKVYINPEITPSGDITATEEGCLSIPGLSARIKRYKNCTVTAKDLSGNTFTEEADGLYARALQHEYDHLEGTMIKDRLSQVAKISAKKLLKQLEENQS